MMKHLVLTIISVCAFCQGVEAAVLITAEEDGPDVVFSWSGSLNTTGLVFGVNIASITGSVGPSFGGFFGYSPATSNINLSNPNILLPASVPFGTAGLTPATSFSGNPFGLDGSGRIALPAFYVSNTPFAGTLTFSGASFDSLGLTDSPTPFIWTVAANGDTIQLTVVPEPTIVSLVGLCAFSLVFRRERRFKRIC